MNGNAVELLYLWWNKTPVEMIRRHRLCTVSLLFLHPHLDFLLSAPPFEVALKTRGIGQICDTNIHALILVLFCEVIVRLFPGIFPTRSHSLVDKPSPEAPSGPSGRHYATEKQD